jgi:glutaconyl-CoA/methylmalonyl-CoA decarboxylase subunit gamma
VHTVTIPSDDHAEVDGHNVPFSLRSYEPGGELARAGAGAGRPVQAVMPGRLVKVLVRPGQRVQKGEPLFILEAMKMQNELTSPAAGVIAEVRGQEGDVVEAGRVLARLEA